MGSSEVAHVQQGTGTIPEIEGLRPEMSRLGAQWDVDRDVADAYEGSDSGIRGPSG